MSKDDSKKLALLGGEPVAGSDAIMPRRPEISSSDIEAVIHHLRNEELSAYEVDSGPLYDFESELRELFAVDYALLVSSGTAALYSAIFGLALESNDEIIVPTLTHPATAAPVLHLGGVVRFVDVDPDSGNPTPESIEKNLTEHTRAVIAAHAWGLPVDLPRLCPILERRSVSLIEDAARAFGTRCAGKDVGTLGIAGCFSLHELKAVAGGEGGILLTRSRELYERAVVLGHYFRCKVQLHLSLPELTDYRDSGLGLNLKIHPLAAALARTQLRKLPARIEAMGQNWARMAQRLEGLSAIKLLRPPAWADKVSYYGFNLRWCPPVDGPCPSRDAVVTALRAEGINASSPGNPLLHTLPLFRHPEKMKLRGRATGSLSDADFPGAVEHYNTLLRLPTLFTPWSQWVNWYAGALEKVANNLSELAQWERGRHGCFTD